jgi:hypothetical protein
LQFPIPCLVQNHDAALRSSTSSTTIAIVEQRQKSHTVLYAYSATSIFVLSRSSEAFAVFHIVTLDRFDIAKEMDCEPRQTCRKTDKKPKNKRTQILRIYVSGNDFDSTRLDSFC